MPQKRCYCCKQRKPLTAFYRNRTRKDGRHDACKPCQLAANKARISRGSARTAHLQYQRDYNAKHREQRRAAQKQWYAKNGRRASLKRRMAKLGGTLELWDSMFKAQDGRCAICNKEETAMLRGQVKCLSVDHDHVTGKIRSLLCTRCNNGLGSFLDDPQLLLAAITYLEGHTDG